MPRQARIHNISDYYHIMVRGINKQNIFEDDEDRRRYLKTIDRFLDRDSEELLAWCLMSNHVHLLLHIKGLPDKLMKKIGCSYVPYFNRKYDRTGHLFQDRYKSEPVYDENYMLTVVRYIHMNPEKAGICLMEDYPWSSYREYLSGQGYASSKMVLKMLGGRDEFISFMNITKDDDRFLDDDTGLTENEAAALAVSILPKGVFSLQQMTKSERNATIIMLRKQGLTPAQICRITGICKTLVYNLLK